MKTLTPDMVYHRPADCASDLVIWLSENSGFAALSQAAADILSGKIVTFALCDREGGHKPVIIKEIVSIGMGTGGNPSDGYAEHAPRYCGEDNDPDGAGSHALIPSWYGDACTDRGSIAAALALAFREHKHFFRLA